MPSQVFYDAASATSRVDAGGCTVASWEGTDPDGILGHPSVSRVTCEGGAAYAASGVALGGHLKFVLWYGALRVNEAKLRMAGDAYWAVGGASVDVSAAGAVGFYVIGSEYRLTKRGKAAITASYNASLGRFYDVLAATQGKGDGSLVHDIHIGNGTTNAKDVIFSQGTSCVEPPHIVVLNCAPTPSESFVWFHSHPQGALYVPFSGRLCFTTSEGKKCVEPGFPRWTSPNLFYYETFDKLPAAGPSIAAATALVAAAQMDACDEPITFAVTNFDPDHAPGQPNFGDVPARTTPCGGGAACPAPNRVGIFDNLVVRTTSCRSTIAQVARPRLH